MKTILDYLNDYGSDTMEERAFCDVDSLILSQFSYLKLDGIVPDIGKHKAVTLSEIAGHPDFEKLFSDERYAKDNRALFQAMQNSTRFHNMKVHFHVNILDEGWELQFSATTFFMDHQTVYAAFRGTDENLVGWKEDFNMAFITPVPAQEKAVQYLNSVAERFSGDFIVGGHSKGGNLAVYAAMNCREEVCSRILKIYSHDGPGFREEILQSSSYERISDRIHKLLPHSSVVGMLLQKQETYEVVDCKSVGLLQHNPFNWLTEGCDFKRSEEIGRGTKIMDDGLNDWVCSLDVNQLRTFVETLYSVVEATDIKTLLDFKSVDKRKNANAIIATIKDMDEDSKKMMKQIIRLLFRQMRDTVIKETQLPPRVSDLLKGEIQK